MSSSHSFCSPMSGFLGGFDGRSVRGGGVHLDCCEMDLLAK